MSTYDVGFVGSRSSTSVNGTLSRALIRLAPKEELRDHVERFLTVLPRP